MIKLKKPDFQQDIIIDDCIDNMREGNGTPRARITASRDILIEKSNKYDKLAELGELGRIKESELSEVEVTKKDMVDLYNNKFARKGEGGRQYYDKIKLLAPYGRCPFCGQRVVKTLDHYLPKAKFPLYAITPYNLIPSCSDCNKDKLTDSFVQREEEIIHPYYDDFASSVWLKARVVKGEPVTFEFYVVKPEDWDDIKYKRACNHFKVFGLNDLYKPYACERFCECLGRIKRILVKGGQEAAKEHLRECIVEKRENRLNTWEEAMYDALLESDWFWKEYLKK